MKNLQNLKGAKTLSKNEQKNVIGGRFGIHVADCRLNGCPSNEVCTEVWGDDTGGPYGEQSPQWVCIDPANYK